MGEDTRDLSALLTGTKPAIENEYIRFDKLSALVIDDIGAMRHAIRSQLQALGMNQVSVTNNADEALRIVTVKSFDLILCDYNLNHASSGQHFLEHLRSEKLLSARTIFIMVTAEAEYAYVANAVEYSPDDYILKPCPEKKLRARLERQFDRRAFLMPVIDALEAKRYARAITESDRLIALQPDEHWLMQTLRLKAEAQLALHDTGALFATYQQALQIRDDAPWVTMGIARAHFMARDMDAATRIAKELIAQHPNYVAAYELLAQIKTKQGDDSAALELLQASAQILPSAKRYRAISESAFLLGQLDEAKLQSEKAIRLSTGSMVERSDDYLALAQIQTDQGDARGAINTLEKNARKYVETGSFGIAKNAILAQAYYDVGATDKAKKLVERAQRLVTPQTDSAALTSLGKAAIKNGNLILGLEVMTRAIEASGAERQRVARHVTKAMQDTGQAAKIAEVIDAGQRRIMILVDEAARLMRSAHFEDAYQKVLAALAIHDENIEALLAAAQLHLLWMKQDSMNDAIVARAKGYLATLDKLVPNNERVMGFYRFFNELTGT